MKQTFKYIAIFWISILNIGFFIWVFSSVTNIENSENFSKKAVSSLIEIHANSTMGYIHRGLDTSTKKYLVKDLEIINSMLDEWQGLIKEKTKDELSGLKKIIERKLLE